MAIAIRDDVANGNPYALVVERLLSERRRVAVYPCPEGSCGPSMIVFYAEQTNLTALEHHVLFFLTRTHPEHDALCTFDEQLPAEVENPTAGRDR
jgi:hypothetical protein